MTTTKSRSKPTPPTFVVDDIRHSLEHGWRLVVVLVDGDKKHPDVQAIFTALATKRRVRIVPA